MRKVTIATERESLEQAIYIDGELRRSDTSLYASEISVFISPDEPVTIDSIEVDLGEDDFPERLRDCKVVR